LHKQPGLAGGVQFLGNGLAERGWRVAELVEALVAENSVERFLAGVAEASANCVGREENFERQPSPLNRSSDDSSERYAIAAGQNDRIRKIYFGFIGTGRTGMSRDPNPAAHSPQREHG
jgi:hypothetical protein